jgi:hypothetical protein
VPIAVAVGIGDDVPIEVIVDVGIGVLIAFAVGAGDEIPVAVVVGAGNGVPTTVVVGAGDNRKFLDSGALTRSQEDYVATVRAGLPSEVTMPRSFSSPSLTMAAGSGT